MLFEILIGFAVIAFAAVILLYWETKKFSVKYDNVYLEKIDEDIKIAFLSDLHEFSYGNENNKLISAIQNEKPDIIIISGDMIVAKPYHTSYQKAFKVFEKLAKIAPVYFANGNHEYRLKTDISVYGTSYEVFRDKITGYGINYLEDSSMEIICKGNQIDIYGLEIEFDYYKRGKKKEMNTEYVFNKLGKINSDRINILLAHNPMYFPQYANWGADLTFSGHLHGGLVRIPFVGAVISPQLELFPKYNAGIYSYKDKQLIVSRGLGTHTIHIRVLNRAELKIITLKKDKKYRN